jgi:acetolactate synthase-1/2/3 large subunit
MTATDTQSFDSDTINQIAAQPASAADPGALNPRGGGSPTGGTTARSAGHVIVDSLVAHGVERTYVGPGESFLDVLDGLHDS